MVMVCITKKNSEEFLKNLSRINKPTKPRIQVLRNILRKKYGRLQLQYKIKEIITLRDFNRLPVEHKKEILKFININKKDIERFLFKEEYCKYLKLRNKLNRKFITLLYSKTITIEGIIHELPLTQKQKQTLISKFNLNSKTPSEAEKLPDNVKEIIKQLQETKYGIPLIITALTPYNELKLKEKKELMKKLGLWKTGECIIYSNHPYTSLRKVEMKLLKLLTYYNLAIITHK